MPANDDIQYFRMREAEEREAAARSRNEVRRVHERMAANYAQRAASATDEGEASAA